MKKGKESKNDLVVVAVRTCLFQTFLLFMSCSVSLLQFEYAWDVQVLAGRFISL